MKIYIVVADGMSAGEHQSVSDVAVDGVCVLFVLTVFVVSVAADVMCCTIVVVVDVIAFISLLVVGVMASVMLRSLDTISYIIT